MAGIGAGLGAALGGGGVPGRGAGGAAMMGRGVSAAGLSPPIPLAHIPAALYGMALDEESQQRAKGLFARLDAVRLRPCPRARPASSSPASKLADSPLPLIFATQDDNGVLTRDDFDFETTGDASGRKQALWTTLIRKFFDEDGGGEVTIHEMIVKLGEQSRASRSESQTLPPAALLPQGKYFLGLSLSLTDRFHFNCSGDMAMEKPGDFTMHNSQAAIGTLVIQMNQVFNAMFKQTLAELEQVIGQAVA